MKSLALLVVPFVAFLIGCGGGDGQKPTTAVSGKVLCKGTALKGGTITFEPAPVGNETEPGRPAQSEIGEDGSFTLSTYGKGDGAVRTRHRVKVQGKAADGSHDASKLPCAVPADLFVEVGDDSLEVEIELSDGTVTTK